MLKDSSSSHARRMRILAASAFSILARQPPLFGKQKIESAPRFRKVNKSFSFPAPCQHPPTTDRCPLPWRAPAPSRKFFFFHPYAIEILTLSE
jgi:hypothetical protein